VYHWSSFNIQPDIERLLGSAFEEYLNELMLEAGRERREFVVQNNRYHEGIPAITVVVDGGWSKWSHSHSYIANSSVVTKKLLYIGVKNKHIKTCLWELSNIVINFEFLHITFYSYLLTRMH